MKRITYLVAAPALLGLIIAVSALLILRSGSEVEAQESPLQLDHFKCYPIVQSLPPPQDAAVVLRDQFSEVDFNGTVLQPIRFCNPVQKSHKGQTRIMDRDHHLKFYLLDASGGPFPSSVTVSNQFDKKVKGKRIPQELSVLASPVFIAVPTHKLQPGPHNEPVGLSHFACYLVTGEPINKKVGLKDEFDREKGVVVTRPASLCNPADKTHDSLFFSRQNEEAHLVCYVIQAKPLKDTVAVGTENQFAVETFTLDFADSLCVPSRKFLFP